MDFIKYFSIKYNLKVWAPPTPPQDENDLYVDYSMGFLYEQSVMPESQLPPIYVPKDAKRLKIDPTISKMLYYLFCLLINFYNQIVDVKSKLKKMKLLTYPGHYLIDHHQLYLNLDVNLKSKNCEALWLEDLILHYFKDC